MQKKKRSANKFEKKKKEIETVTGEVTMSGHTESTQKIPRIEVGCIIREHGAV